VTTMRQSLVVQEKTRSYIEQAPSDDFIFLAIEMYGCLHFALIHFLPLVHKLVSRIISNLL